VPQPKLSKSVQQLVEEKKPMTEQEIAVAEQERKAMVATLRQRSAETPALTATPTTDAVVELFAKFSQPAQEADAARTAARQVEAQVLVGDLLTRGKAAQTKLGMLQTKHLARIQAVLAIDFEAVRRALPHDFQIAPGAREAISPSREVVRNIEAHGREATIAMSSTLGDQGRSKNDIDPQSLAGVMVEVQSALDSRLTHESAEGMLKAGLLRNVSHLRTWGKRAEATVKSAETHVQCFDGAVARAQALLVDLVPGTAAPAPEKRSIPVLEPPPAPRNGSSYVDFDPRGR
jgi:hypothetical protein